MTRSSRIEFPGAWYHVVSQSAAKRDIYSDDIQRRYFMNLLGEMSKTYRVEVHVYCQMTNHYHLLLHTPLGNLSQALRHLNGVYAQYLNRVTGTAGPLFRGRFRSILIDADRYLLTLSRYIHLNPVASGQVRYPASYPWSSYRAYIGADKPEHWLHTEAILEKVGKRNVRHRYRRFVEEDKDDVISMFYTKGRLSPILGDEDFRRRIDSLATENERVSNQTVTPMESVVQAVATAFDVETNGVVEGKRGRGKENIPRQAAIYLCRRELGFALKEIAIHFHLQHYASVSEITRRFEVRLGTDTQIHRKVKRLWSQFLVSQSSQRSIT